MKSRLGIVFLLIILTAALLTRKRNGKQSFWESMPEFDRRIRLTWLPKTRWIEQINFAAIQERVPQILLEAILWTESTDGQNLIGLAGEVGPMQIMPGTLELLHRNSRLRQWSPFDIQGALVLGAVYLRMNYEKFGQWWKATIAYNSGPNSERVNNPHDGYLEKVWSRVLEISSEKPL